MVYSRDIRVMWIVGAGRTRTYRGYIFTKKFWGGWGGRDDFNEGISKGNFVPLTELKVWSIV